MGQKISSNCSNCCYCCTSSTNSTIAAATTTAPTATKTTTCCNLIGNRKNNRFANNLIIDNQNRKPIIRNQLVREEIDRKSATRVVTLFAQFYSCCDLKVIWFFNEIQQNDDDIRPRKNGFDRRKYQFAKIDDIYVLQINSFETTDCGYYTCFVVNSFGTISLTYCLNIVQDNMNDNILMAKLSSNNDPDPESNLRENSRPIISCENPNLKHETAKLFSRTKSNEIPIDRFAQIDQKFELITQIKDFSNSISMCWFRNDEKLDVFFDKPMMGKFATSCRYRLKVNRYKTISLVIEKIEMIDSGDWKCILIANDRNQNQVTTVYRYRIFVTAPTNYLKPMFVRNLKVNTSENGLISFECKVIGFPTPQLHWFKDNVELKPGDLHKLTGYNSLGSYCCLAKNSMGEDRSFLQLTLDELRNVMNFERDESLDSKPAASKQPFFIKNLQSLSANILDPIEFVVEIKCPGNSLDYMLEWFRNGYRVKPDDKYRIVNDSLGTGQSKLEISKLEIEDEGEWKCLVTNTFGKSVSKCFLKLKIPKTFRKPEFLSPLRIKQINRNMNVSIECEIGGYPQPNLKWYKNDNFHCPISIENSVSDSRSATLNIARSNYTLGKYTCEARNCLGTIRKSIVLFTNENCENRNSNILSTASESIDYETARSKKTVSLPPLPPLPSLPSLPAIENVNVSHETQSITNNIDEIYETCNAISIESLANSDDNFSKILSPINSHEIPIDYLLNDDDNTNCEKMNEMIDNNNNDMIDKNYRNESICVQYENDESEQFFSFPNSIEDFIDNRPLTLSLSSNNNSGLSNETYCDPNNRNENSNSDCSLFDQKISSTQMETENQLIWTMKTEATGTGTVGENETEILSGTIIEFSDSFVLLTDIDYEVPLQFSNEYDNEIIEDFRIPIDLNDSGFLQSLIVDTSIANNRIIVSEPAIKINKNVFEAARTIDDLANSQKILTIADNTMNLSSNDEILVTNREICNEAIESIEEISIDDIDNPLSENITMKCAKSVDFSGRITIETDNENISVGELASDVTDNLNSSKTIFDDNNNDENLQNLNRIVADVLTDPNVTTEKMNVDNLTQNDDNGTIEMNQDKNDDNYRQLTVKTKQENVFDNSKNDVIEPKNIVDNASNQIDGSTDKNQTITKLNSNRIVVDILTDSNVTNDKNNDDNRTIEICKIDNSIKTNQIIVDNKDKNDDTYRQLTTETKEENVLDNSKNDDIEPKNIVDNSSNQIDRIINENDSIINFNEPTITTNTNDRTIPIACENQTITKQNSNRIVDILTASNVTNDKNNDDNRTIEINQIDNSIKINQNIVDNKDKKDDTYRQLTTKNKQENVFDNLKNSVIEPKTINENETKNIIDNASNPIVADILTDSNDKNNNDNQTIEISQIYNSIKTNQNIIEISEKSINNDNGTNFNDNYRQLTTETEQENIFDNSKNKVIEPKRITENETKNIVDNKNDSIITITKKKSGNFANTIKNEEINPIAKSAVLITEKLTIGPNTYNLNNSIEKVAIISEKTIARPILAENCKNNKQIIIAKLPNNNRNSAKPPTDFNGWLTRKPLIIAKPLIRISTETMKWQKSSDFCTNNFLRTKIDSILNGMSSYENINLNKSRFSAATAAGTRNICHFRNSQTSSISNRNVWQFTTKNPLDSNRTVFYSPFEYDFHRNYRNHVSFRSKDIVSSSIGTLTNKYFDNDPRSIPVFKSRPNKKYTLLFGDDFTISCRVHGNPRPTISVLKGIQDITNEYRSYKWRCNDYVQFTRKKVTYQDEGTYCVLAKNFYGSDRSFVTLYLKK